MYFCTFWYHQPCEPTLSFLKRNGYFEDPAVSERKLMPTVKERRESTTIQKVCILCSTYAMELRRVPTVLSTHLPSVLNHVCSYRATTLLSLSCVCNCLFAISIYGYLILFLIYWTKPIFCIPGETPAILLETSWRGCFSRAEYPNDCNATTVHRWSGLTSRGSSFEPCGILYQRYQVTLNIYLRTTTVRTLVGKTLGPIS